MDIDILYNIVGEIHQSIEALDKKGMGLIEAQDIAGIIYIYIYMEVWI